VAPFLIWICACSFLKNTIMLKVGDASFETGIEIKIVTL